MWLKYSNNDRGNAAFDLFKESINTHATPLQVRGNKGPKKNNIRAHGDAEHCATKSLHWW